LAEIFSKNNLGLGISRVGEIWGEIGFQAPIIFSVGNLQHSAPVFKCMMSLVSEDIG